MQSEKESSNTTKIVGDIELQDLQDLKRKSSGYPWVDVNAVDLVIKADVEIESEQQHSWDDGLEGDEGWNEHLLKYKRKWSWASACVAAPGLVIFCFPFFVKMITGLWWMTAMSGWTKGTMRYYDTPTMPTVLNSHMFLACGMLVLLITQCCLALCVTMKKSIPGDCQHVWHRWVGRFAVFVIVICSATGTMALAFCDVGPKRGIENAFFVWIGIVIIVLCIKAAMFAARKEYGLHMQYMFMTLFYVTSPGWNRITAILLRAIQKGSEAFSNENVILCQAIPNPQGYYFTWSFLAGQIYYYLIWFLFGVPFAKRYSLGFWINILTFVLCLICVWEMIRNAGHVGLFDNFDCTKEELEHAALVRTAMVNHGEFDLAQAYGLCMPVNAKHAMRIASLYANPNTTYIQGY